MSTPASLTPHSPATSPVDAPAMLYLHGLGSGIGGLKVQFLRKHFAGAIQIIEPEAPGLPYCRAKLEPLVLTLLQRLGGPIRLLEWLSNPSHIEEFLARTPELKTIFSHARQSAQSLVDRFRPRLIIGSSLGGGLAMTLETGDTPLLLIAPVWNTEVNPPPVRLAAGDALDPKHFVPLAAAAFGTLLAQAIGFEVPHRVKPRTIIIHCPYDQVYDLRHSIALLANSKVDENSESANAARAITSALASAGYRPPDGADARLIAIGKDHASIDPNPADTLNRNPDPLQALGFAADVLMKGN